MKNVKDILLKWYKPCELDELNDFFAKNKNVGGLYIWIFKGKHACVRYIGETKNFQERFFNYHLQNVTHGFYSAIECGTDEDLCDKYIKIYLKGDEAEPNLCYQPQPAEFNSKTLKKYVKNLKRGIQLSIKNFLNCYFLFAEIKCEDFPVDEALRKEVERIFMLKTREAYLGIDDDEKCWSKFSKVTEAFWGTMMNRLDENCQYIFTNTFPDNNTRLQIKELLNSIDIN